MPRFDHPGSVIRLWHAISDAALLCVFYFGSSILNFQELQILLIFFIVVCLFETGANLSLPWQSSCLSLLSTGVTAGITMPIVWCLWCLESPRRWKLCFKKTPPPLPFHALICSFWLEHYTEINWVHAAPLRRHVIRTSLWVPPLITLSATPGETCSPRVNVAVLLCWNIMTLRLLTLFLIEKRTSKRAISNPLRADLSL